jgi:hypothetical protein
MAAQVSTLDKTNFIRRVLLFNVALSLVAGFLLLVDATPIAEFMGMSRVSLFDGLDGVGFLRLVGVMCIGFAPFIAFAAARRPFDTRLGWAIVALDVTWVAISALDLVTNGLGLSSAGSWAMLIQADMVLVIAVLEIVGVSRAQA